MSTKAPLHLVRLAVDRQAASAFAARHKVLDDDLGYALHLALRRRFGEAGPQPFRRMPNLPSVPEPGSFTLLAYSRDADGLERRFHEHVATGTANDDELLERVFPSPPDSRRMPTDWVSLPQLAFEVLVRPVRRHGSKVRAARLRSDAAPLGGEHDAFLSAVERLAEGDPLPDREAIYAGWLAERLGPAAKLVGDCRMDTFRRTRLRRSRHARGGTRAVEGPEALMSGRLEITDGAAFDALLGKGVGRHAAFGFGMLLLSPVRT